MQIDDAQQCSDEHRRAHARRDGAALTVGDVDSVISAAHAFVQRDRRGSSHSRVTRQGLRVAARFTIYVHVHYPWVSAFAFGDERADPTQRYETAVSTGERSDVESTLDLGWS